MFIKVSFFSIDILSLSVILSVAFVISLLRVYIPWYMRQEPLKIQFYGLISAFTFSILILSITSVGLIFLVFWEILRICSYLLVGWWKRRIVATSIAVVGLLSSRIRDVCLFLIVLRPLQESSLSTKILIIIAVSSKSAQLLYFPWLLRAIERPRPVSALLHSSTLVLARVILSYRITELRTNVLLFYSGILGIILRVFRTAVFIDLKKRVACSTIYNIRFIFIWIYMRYTNVLFTHIVVHAIVKASTFVLLRVSSHLLNVQDYRIFLGFSNKQITSIFILLISLLSLLPLLGVLTFKEYRLELMSSITTVNLVLYLIVIRLRVTRFLFILEYSILLNSSYTSSFKNLTSPLMVHSFISITLVPIRLIIAVLTYIGPLSTNPLISNYLLLLIVAIFILLYFKGRSYFLNFNYVSDYNTSFLRNIYFTKLTMLGLEYHSIFSSLNKSEWLLYTNSRPKLTSRVLFITILLFILLVLLIYVNSIKKYSYLSNR